MMYALDAPFIHCTEQKNTAQIAFSNIMMHSIGHMHFLY